MADRCQDCDYMVWWSNGMVMLREELWLSIAKKEDFLCAKCIEKKLERKIKLSDFKLFKGEMIGVNINYAIKNKLLKLEDISDKDKIHVT